MTTPFKQWQRNSQSTGPDSVGNISETIVRPVSFGDGNQQQLINTLSSQNRTNVNSTNQAMSVLSASTTTIATNSNTPRVMSRVSLSIQQQQTNSSISNSSINNNRVTPFSAPSKVSLNSGANNSSVSINHTYQQQNTSNSADFPSATRPAMYVGISNSNYSRNSSPPTPPPPSISVINQSSSNNNINSTAVAVHYKDNYQPTPREQYYDTTETSSATTAAATKRTSAPSAISTSLPDSLQLKNRSTPFQSSSATTTAAASITTTQPQQQSSQNYQKYLVTTTGTTTTNASNLQPYSQQTQHRLQVQPQQQQQQQHNIERQPLIEKTYDQQLFLREALYMWLGVDETQILYYDNIEKCYKLRGGNEAQRDMFSVLQVVGTTVRNIDELVKCKTHSFLQQSLKAAVRKQLLSFYYFVSSLRDQQSLSFSQLTVASMKVRAKLQLLLNLLLDTENVKGGELATKLEVFHRQGSQRLADLMSEIYNETMGPLLHMTIQWLTKGETPDPFVEFFITVNDRVKETAENFWTSKYTLRIDMLPVTVPVPVATKILTVAKNIVFIRRCCRAKDWTMDPTIVAAAQDADFKTIPRVADDALRYTNQATIRLLTEKLKFDDVLSIIRAFFLVGNGDFFEVLIQRLDAVLCRMCPHVELSTVRDQFKSALLDTAPTTRHLNTDLFQTLDCTLEVSDHITGWEAFQLIMVVPSPLNNVFDDHALRQYRRLFRMMLTVKRAEVALKQSWRQSVVIDRVVVRMNPRSREALNFREGTRDGQLLGMKLLHFVNNLWSYFVYEVSMATYERFKDALKQCSSFDDVRAAHEKFLHELRLYSLLGVSESGSARKNIETILTLCRQYCNTQILLTDLVEHDRGNIVPIREEFRRIGEEFHITITSLLVTLDEQYLQFDFMNFLLLRLNFNQYFLYNGAKGENREF